MLPGHFYSGPSPCQCGDNVDDCGMSDMQGCVPDGQMQCRQFELMDFSCPTGATQFCAPVLDPADPAQARAACELCYGVECYDESADCAGNGFGPSMRGDYACGDAYFGYQDGCTGESGRIWSIWSSSTTYGY